MKIVSEIFMQAALSSVNLGSFVAPKASRKRREAARSDTGKFTKIMRDIYLSLANRFACLFTIKVINSNRLVIKSN